MFFFTLALNIIITDKKSKIMKILHSFWVVLFLLMTTVLNAQEYQAMLVLDNYTVPMDVKGAKIGQFVVSENKVVTLVSDKSELFEITKGGELKLKKNKLITAASPMVFEITVECEGAKKSFDIVKDEFIKNKVIAHRGGWKHSGASQNTIGSLKHAIEIGCQGSELDVWLTKDRKVVLNHDADLDGKIVEKTTLADLQTVKLNKGEKAPTLEDYINLVKTQNKTKLVIELKSNKKNDNVIALADSCVNIVHRMKAQAWVDYISFDYRGLKVIRALDATAHIAFLEPSVDLDLQKLDGISGIDYQYKLYDKIEKLKERCDALGLTTNAWTVNSKEALNKFLDLDLNFITTDEPEMLLELIKARK